MIYACALAMWKSFIDKRLIILVEIKNGASLLIDLCHRNDDMEKMTFPIDYFVANNDLLFIRLFSILFLS